MKSSLPHILALCLLPGLALSQGVPTNDSGLTARDIVETGDREELLLLIIRLPPGQGRGLGAIENRMNHLCIVDPPQSGPLLPGGMLATRPNKSDRLYVPVSAAALAPSPLAPWQAAHTLA